MACPRACSRQQQDIADTADVIGLGVLSQSGQQKGVDALLVTDLVELARNRAISDAVLISGDEDVRIGVQIAQSFGVRVHLIGIEPSRGNQSRTLMQEADSTAEWSKSEIDDLLTLRLEAQAGIGETSTQDDTNSALDEVINDALRLCSRMRYATSPVLARGIRFPTTLTVGSWGKRKSSKDPRTI